MGRVSRHTLRAFMGHQASLVVWLVVGLWNNGFLWANPLPPEAQWRVANAHFNSKRWDLAAEEFRLFLRHYPDHPKRAQAELFLAECLLHQGLFSEARDLYQTLYDHWVSTNEGATTLPSPAENYLSYLSSIRPILTFRLAESLFLADKENPQRLDRAAELFETFCRQWPQNPLEGRAWNYLGQLRFKQGRVQEAIFCLRRALALTPNDPLADAARLRLAECLETTGELEEACRLYYALSRKPTFSLAPAAAWRLARLYQAQNLLTEAAETYEYIFSTWPEASVAARSRVALAQVYLMMSRPEDAEAVLRNVEDHPQVRGQALYWRAVAQMQQEKVAEALRTLELIPPATAEVELAGWVRLRKAEALLKLSDPEGAFTELEAILGPPSSSTEVVGSLPSEAGDLHEYWIRLAIAASLASGRLGRAAALADRVIAAKTSRFQPETYVRAAQALIAQKRNQEALTMLEPLLQLALPAKVASEIEYLLAICYLGAANAEKASKLWIKLANTGSDKVATQAALRLGEQAHKLGNQAEARFWALKAHKLATSARDSEAIAHALFLLSTIAMEEADIEEARQLTARMSQLPLPPGRRQELVHAIAQKALELGHLTWARQILLDLINHKGDKDSDVAVIIDLAWCEVKLGQALSAISLLTPWTTIIDENQPLWPSLWFVLAQAAEQSGLIDLAETAYQQVVRTSPVPLATQATWCAARFYHRLGNVELARWLYENLWQDDAPEIPRDELLFNWALLEKSAGSARHAELLTELCTNFPESSFTPEAYLELAENALRSQDLLQAEEHLLSFERDISRVTPESASRGAYLRGVLDLAKQEWQKAEDCFRKLLSEGEGERAFGARVGLAEALYQQNRLEEALEIFEDLALQDALAPRHDDSQVARVKVRVIQILIALERWNEAHRKAQEFLAAVPSGPEVGLVHFLLGHMLYRDHKLAEARPHLIQATHLLLRQNATVAAESQLLLAESYFLAEDYRAALREYLRLEILFPGSELVPGAVLQAARCYWEMGLREEALRQVKRIVEQWPESPYAPKAKQWLTAINTGSQNLVIPIGKPR